MIIKIPVLPKISIKTKSLKPKLFEENPIEPLNIMIEKALKTKEAEKIKNLLTPQEGNADDKTKTNSQSNTN